MKSFTGVALGRIGFRMALLLFFSVCFSSWAQEADPALRRLAAANGLFQRGLYKLAAQEYEEFLAKSPSHVDATTARYALAVCQFRLGAHGLAVAELNKVVADEKFPQRSEALLVLAHAHLGLKQTEPALSILDRIIATYPTSTTAETASLNRAQSLYLLDRKEASAAAAEQFLKAYPDSARRPEALYALALSQFDLGRHDAALKTTVQLARDYPNSRPELDGRLLAGKIHESRNDLHAAAEQYRSFSENVPQERRGEGLFALGSVLYKSARYDQSAKALESLLKHHPASPYLPAARLQLGLTHFSARRINDARQVFREVTTADASRAPFARYWLAQCDIVDNRFEQALQSLTELSKLDSPPIDSGQLLLDRAQCLMGLEKFAQAAAHYTEYRQRFPDGRRVLDAAYQQALALHKLSRPAESLGLLKEISFPADHALNFSAAQLVAENLFALARYDEAERAFEELAGKAPDEQTRLRLTLRQAQAEYSGGDYDDAIKLLRPLAERPQTARDDVLSLSLLLLGDAYLQIENYKLAVDALNKYLPLAKSNRAEAQFKLGLSRLRSGDSAGAEKDLASAMNDPKQSSWNQRATFEFAQLKYKQNQPAAAGDALRRLTAVETPAELAAPALYLLAWIELDSNKHLDAANQFEQMVAKFPDHALAADARFHRAVALRQANRLQDAADAFSAYLKAHPSAPHAQKARQLLASCLVKLNQFEAAVATLKAVAANSKNVTDEVLYELAWSQHASGNSAEAEKTYRRLLTDFKKSKLAPAARSELGETLFKQEKFTQAAEVLREAVNDPTAEDQTRAVATYRLASTLDRLGEHTQAASLFDQFARQNPKDELALWARYQAAVNLARAERLSESAQRLGALLDAAPSPDLAAPALLKLAEVTSQQNGHAQAEKLYRAFLDRFPKDPTIHQAHFGLGWTAEQQKQYEQARAWYEKVTAAHSGPTAARAQFQIGETYFAQGQHEKALAALLAVADVYAYPEWSARALLEAGRAFEQLRQLDHARQQYRTVTQKYKDTPEAALAAKRLAALEPKPQ